MTWYEEPGGPKTFVAIEDAGAKTILGFYSLCPDSVDYARTPEIIRRALARHDVPGFRLARLAVDRRMQRQGLAANFCSRRADAASWPRSKVGGVVLVNDAKNEGVAGWYASYGAVPLLDAPLLPLATIWAELRKAGKY